jgi:superfamily II DNA/RNA helicase
MKENVEKSIAPKEETIVEVELTTLQKKYYRAIYERNFTFLRKGNKSSNMPSLLNVMMELRKCCNHPYLIKGVEQNETEHLTLREQIYHKLIEASGKMVLIDKLLPKLKAGGHKVLIFSQMVRVLDILEDYLVWKGYTHERLDGRIRGNDRQAAIDRFSKPDSDRFVFLLCTRAGGLGINLTAADTVIIFDSDWNPQNDVQAQARCHRIGQEKSVKVYRLITRNTYEKRMFERASKKLGLDQAVLTKMNAGSTTASSTAEESSAVAADPILDKKVIDSLLKYGAYDLFREDDTAANRFYEEDIDKILERATVVKSTQGAETPDNPLSSFSKASFVSNSAAPELDINDPDFWNKLLPQAADAPNPNIQVQPRVRRQVHRFGALDGIYTWLLSHPPPKYRFSHKSLHNTRRGFRFGR